MHIIKLRTTKLVSSQLTSINLVKNLVICYNLCMLKQIDTGFFIHFELSYHIRHIQNEV